MSNKTTTLDSVSQSIADLSGKLDAHINRLDAKIDDLGESVAQSISNLNDHMDERFNKVDQRLYKVDTRLSDIETNQRGMNVSHGINYSNSRILP